MLSLALFIVFVVSMVLVVVRGLKNDIGGVGIIYFVFAMASGIWWAMRTWPGTLL